MPSKYSELDEQAVLAGEGNEKAWLAIYTTLWPVAIEFLRRKTHLPHVLAEDLAQDAFVDTLRKLHLWNPERGHFVAWFFGIMNNRCNTYWRVTSRAHLTSLDQEGIDPPALTDEANEVVDLEAVRAVLARMLPALNPNDRRILFAMATGSLSPRELAADLEIDPLILRRRVRTLRRHLENAWVEAGGTLDNKSLGEDFAPTLTVDHRPRSIT